MPDEPNRFSAQEGMREAAPADRKPACLSSPVIKTGLRVSDVRFPPARGIDLCESNGKERAFKGCMPPARRFTYPPHHKKGRAAKA